MNFIRFFIVLALFVMPLTACGNSESKNEAGMEMPDSKKKAPDFALTDVNGKTVKLSDYKGKIIILDFWATWCPPCRKGIPDLISIQKEFPKDVVIIGISVDRDKTKGEVPGFVKSYGINYPVVYFNDKVVDDYEGIEAIPTSFIIDKKGNIVDKHVGLVDKSVYTNLIKKLK